MKRTLSIQMDEELHTHLIRWSVYEKKKLPDLIRETLKKASGFGEVNFSMKAFPRRNGASDPYEVLQL